MTRSPIPADLRPQDVCAIIDTREQLPYTLSPLQTVRGALDTGDYSICGCEQYIALERKSLDDLVSCCGTERERFEREIMRLLAYPSRAVIVEASWAQMDMGGWRSRISASSVTGSVLSWMALGVPFLFAGDRMSADAAAARFLYIAARRRWREARGLVANVLQLEQVTEGAA